MERELDHKAIGMNRDAIKYIAMFTMFLNHFATVFLTPGTPLFVTLLDIGYFTAITMCYFLVEGYQYTRSKTKYGRRLLLFAVLSQLPYNLAFSSGTLEFTGFNMIFTLFLCFLILVVLERVSNPVLRVMAVLLLVFLSLFSDWALLAPAFTILFAYCRGDKKKFALSYGAAVLMFGGFNYLGLIEMYSKGQALVMAVGAAAGILLSGLVILLLYNGQRAKRGQVFSKWFFYIFYPAHLLVLGVVRLCIL